MRLLILLYLFFDFSTISGLTTIRRIPEDGPIVEKDDANVTLICDVPDTVDSVIWYYNGFVLRQIPDEGCSDDVFGSGSGDGGSRFEGSYDPEYSLESNSDDFSDSRMRRNIMEISEVELTNLVGDDVYEYDDVYSDLELSGSSGDEVIIEDLNNSGDGGSGDDDEIYDDILLCDVDPSQLILHDVSRQFSGQYSCAPVVNNKIGPKAEKLEIEVECKFFFKKKNKFAAINSNTKKLPFKKSIEH